jgi:hypothetical protein
VSYLIEKVDKFFLGSCKIGLLVYANKYEIADKLRVQFCTMLHKTEECDRG